MVLRKATIDDEALLLVWRNDEFTRVNSFNQDPVTPEAHALWLKASLNNTNRLLFIVEESGAPVGMLRIDSLEDGNKELSWNVSPQHRGTGIGRRMVRMIVERHPAWSFVARIKTHNVASIKIAEHAGLRFVREEGGASWFSS
jgi:RimJ/RimL family protein N-acetyltransferase